ncbi:BTAD domain-containing putative transcriptional regulator [Kribbella sp. NPDC004536]|uniref:AfsR/SARP family transcriptional regulator n=1 Tax=Kribbella sp. NPDC004536 TaxID=3364106 RepID=UPI0036BFC4CB
MTDERVTIRLLGPIDVVRGGVPRSVAGKRRNAVLAILALNVGQVVSAERLIALVWGDCPPATAMNTLQSTVSFLRRQLDLGSLLRAKSPGYVITLGREGVDAMVTEQLIRESRGLRDPQLVVQKLSTALDMWRGQPLAGLTDVAVLDDHAARLDMLHRTATRSLIDARLALGEHAIVVGDLEQACAQDPLDEELHTRLMLALYRCGRQADALSAFHRLRHRLEEDLGINPSPRVQDLHTGILRQDRSLDIGPPWSDQLTVATPVVVPAQLPPVPLSFVGREHELRQLDNVSARSTDPNERPARSVAVISGMPGIGKTMLALHWAHLCIESFPDGQLYIDLQGSGESAPALSSFDVLGTFLGALGVPFERIPHDLHSRAGLYRSLMAKRRTLVLLDNARDAEQVMPLLPGMTDGLVLITSRDQLVRVIIAIDACVLPLRDLTDSESYRLLVARLGTACLEADPAASRSVIAMCGGRPLTLAFVAARALSEGATSLHRRASDLAAEAGLEQSIRIPRAGCT